MKIICPDCGKEAICDLVSQLKAHHRIEFTIRPEAGQLLAAKTVGGTLAAMQGLLKSMGRDHAAQTDVLVESIECVDGAVTFRLMVLNHAKGAT